jgi:DNA-binding XRE family transcriptional regulator
MKYSTLFKRYRLEKKLSQGAAARKAGVNRSTVVNLESGRPVRFETVAQIMAAMGYGKESAEIKLLVLLWTEKATGVSFTSAEAASLVHDARRVHGKEVAAAVSCLQNEIEANHLSTREVDLLIFAARHACVIDSLEAISRLVPQDKKSSAGRH